MEVYMKKVFIIFILIIAAVACNREKVVTYEGVYQYNSIAGEVCSFTSVADATVVELGCSQRQVRNLKVGDAAYIEYAQTPSARTLKDVSKSLMRLEMQASWGQDCDFYFPVEDWWRELECSDAQQTQLAVLGSEPLNIVYYADDDDTFYLASMTPYKSEFTVRMRYIGNTAEQQCEFFDTVTEQEVTMGCTKTQRAALDRYYKNSLLDVRYTDAGGYRLLSYETESGVSSAGNGAAANATADAEGGAVSGPEDENDDYEATFQVKTGSGRFVEVSSTAETCVFNENGKILKLTCTEDDFEKLKANSNSVYEIYYTPDGVLFSADVAN
jgi:hypothetical protein